MVPLAPWNGPKDPQRMAGHFLYSTNAYIKLVIQKEFRKDLHYVWCSETFDSRRVDPYSIRANVPPTSNPAEIYQQLKGSSSRADAHCPKIREQKLSFKKLAIEWSTTGDITSDERDEIMHLVDIATFPEWRPLLYIIPQGLVADRTSLVARPDRAGSGPEYIVRDMKRSEFDVLEV